MAASRAAGPKREGGWDVFARHYRVVTLPPRFRVAYGIAWTGVVVGEGADRHGATHALLYEGGRLRDLGTLGGSSSCARGVNAHGEVVGGSHIASDVAYHGFHYANGLMRDLNVLVDSAEGWELLNALDVADDGAIVALASKNGVDYVVRLEPIGVGQS